ncbi:MAG: hypothetical protein ACYT04_80710, partial [Nostoc sp.]
ILNEKLHPFLGWSFWAWGMGHREELPISNAQATGRLSLSTHKGMKFPAAFDKSPDCLKMSVQSFITE